MVTECLDCSSSFFLLAYTVYNMESIYLKVIEYLSVSANILLKISNEKFKSFKDAIWPLAVMEVSISQLSGSSIMLSKKSSSLVLFPYKVLKILELQVHRVAATVGNRFFTSDSFVECEKNVGVPLSFIDCERTRFNLCPWQWTISAMAHFFLVKRWQTPNKFLQLDEYIWGR